MTENDSPLVLITHPLPEDWIAPLREKCRVMIGPEEGRGVSPRLEEHLAEAQGLITLLDDPVDARLLERAPALQVVANMAVGYDNIDVEACTAREIRVGNTPGVLTEGTADLTLALMLAVARRLPQASRDAKEGRWSNWDPTGWLGEDLKHAVVGIVGMGKIGTAVAERVRAFESEIIFNNRSPKPDLEARLPAQQVSLEELLERSDFVSLHVPLTGATDGMIDEKALQRMKSTAILINAARGAVVDSAALVKALEKGWIRAAGLDVTDPEPLPPDHALYGLENCLITPHIGSATRNTRRTMADLTVNNVLAGLQGKPLPHQVNPELDQG